MHPFEQTQCSAYIFLHKGSLHYWKNLSSIKEIAQRKGCLQLLYCINAANNGDVYKLLSVTQAEH